MSPTAEPQRRTFEMVKAQLTRNYLIARRRGLHVPPNAPFSHPFPTNRFYTQQPLLTHHLTFPTPNSGLTSGLTSPTQHSSGPTAPNPTPTHPHFQSLLQARTRIYNLITSARGTTNRTPATAAGFPLLQRDVLVELAAKIWSGEAKVSCVNWHCLTWEDKQFFWEELDRAGQVLWGEYVGECVRAGEEKVNMEKVRERERGVEERERRLVEREREMEREMERGAEEREKRLEERERELEQKEKRVKDREWEVADREFLVRREEAMRVPGGLLPIGHERPLWLQNRRNDEWREIKKFLDRAHQKRIEEERKKRVEEAAKKMNEEAARKTKEEAAKKMNGETSQ